MLHYFRPEYDLLEIPDISWTVCSAEYTSKVNKISNRFKNGLDAGVFAHKNLWDRSIIYACIKNGSETLNMIENKSVLHIHNGFNSNLNGLVT